MENNCECASEERDSSVSSAASTGLIGSFLKELKNLINSSDDHIWESPITGFFPTIPSRESKMSMTVTIIQKKTVKIENES